MHQEININDDSKMMRVYSDMMTDPPWVFVGSTISLFSPTSVPNGNEISGAVSSWLINKNEERIGSDFISNTRNLLSQVLFEHLFERSPNTDKVKTSINSFLKDAPANALHESLIQALSNGIIAGIVTTNYDLCFEHTNDFYKQNIKIIVNESDAIHYSAGDKIIFKIHGTCNNDMGEAIHCTLKDEHKMQNWKRDLLSKIFCNSSILFTGYSGYDFEICSEIAEFHDVRKVYWNDKKQYEELSNNAKEIIERFNGAFLHGDMVSVIFSVCKQLYKAQTIVWFETDSRMCELKAKLESAFDNEELSRWLLFLLNACGYAKAVYCIATKQIKVKTASNGVISQLYEQLAAARYKMGLYKSASWYYFLAAYKCSANKARMIGLLIEMIETYKTGYFLGKAIVLLRICQSLLTKHQSELKTEELKFLKARLGYRKNELGARLSKVNLGIITLSILTFIKYEEYEENEEIQEALAEQGDWITNYNDRITHARGLANVSDYYLICEKMKDMGCKFEYFYDFRRYAERRYSEFGRASIDTSMHEKMLEIIKQEQDYGIYPESWKLKRFLCKIGLLAPEKKWREDFRKCEYSFYGRIMLKKELFTYTI